MNKNGPIIIIEDDLDDQIFIKDVFLELNYPNAITFFKDGEEALAYLTTTKEEPFIVISDINMPRLNGIQLRERIVTNENLRLKCIPYLFFTTTSNQRHVIDAYSKSVQGFFIKPPNFEQLREMIDIIIKYWLNCESPNYIP